MEASLFTEPVFAGSFRHTRSRGHAGSRAAGFSLVEVTLAIGLVAFALTAIVSVLPTGLQTVQDAVAQQTTSSVAQQIQATLQQVSFANYTDPGQPPLNRLTLPENRIYYTVEGVEIPRTAGGGVPDGAIFCAAFTVGLPVAGGSAPTPLYPGSTVDATWSPGGSLPSAQNVTMTISYVPAGAAGKAKNFVYSFLVAKQRLE